MNVSAFFQFSKFQFRPVEKQEKEKKEHFYIKKNNKGGKKTNSV